MSFSSSGVIFPPVTMTTTQLSHDKSGILFDCKAANAAAPEGSTTRPVLKNVFTALQNNRHIRHATL